MSENINNNNNNNCRWGEVILLDGRSVEILIQPRLFAGDLFDTVASHFDLKEKEYFGLAFLDETGQYNWLNLERRVLEHEYAQKFPSYTISKQSKPNIPIINDEQKEKCSLSSTTTTMANCDQSIENNKRIFDSNKSNSRRPTVNKIKSLKNKNKSHKQSSMVDSLKRPLVRLIHNPTKSKTKLSNGKNIDETPPPLPQVPPPQLPLVFDTPELIVLDQNNHRKLMINNEDPLYDVINDNSDCYGTFQRESESTGNNKQNTNDDNKNQQQTTMINGYQNNESMENNYEELLPTNNNNLVVNNEDNSSLNIGTVSENENDLEYDDNKEDPLILYFLVKYFVESITMLKDANTIELFYLQAKSLLINEIVQVDLETALKLSALALQATYGDYINFNTTKIRNRIHRLQLISSSLLSELISYQNCEDHILKEYRRLVGVSHGESVFRFLTLIEKQPTYGVHFYEVKDKSGTPYWLGLSFKGIDQFSYTDRRLPLKQFPWKQLENLYFRGKKFSIEVRDLKRVVHALSSINLYENAIEDPDSFDDLSSAICDPTTQVSVSRRTFGPCNVTVYVWFASTSSLTKCIWSMAISQHQFYIDRSINKCNKFQRTKEEIVRSLDENYLSRLLFRNNSKQQQRNSYTSGQRNSLYSSIENNSSSASNYSTNSLTNYPIIQSRINNYSTNNQESSIKSSSLISLNQVQINSLDSIGGGPTVLRTNSQSLSQTSLIHRNTPFRHSTSASSIHKISATYSVPPAMFSSKMSSNNNNNNNNNRKNKMNKLRQLQAQLQMKLDELNQLDLLEQQILSKASSTKTHKNQNVQQESNDANSTITSTSSRSSSSTSSSFDHQNRLLLDNKKNGPISFTKTSSNSLKNFVVTGRASSSLSQAHYDPRSSRLASNYPQITINYPINMNNANNSQQTNNNVDQSIPIHQRSKSVGVNSRFNLDQRNQQLAQCNDVKSINNTIQSIKQINLPTPMKNATSMTMTNHLNEHLNSKSVINGSNKPSLFSSPYVNKYDISVQSLLNDNERSNLYSVPNQRTSVALNSVDDLVLHQRSNSQNLLNKNNPVDLMIAKNEKKKKDNINNNLKYSIVTTSVTSNVNSLTYSTISYQYENHNPNINNNNRKNESLASYHLNDNLMESSVDDDVIDGNNRQDYPSKSPPLLYRNIDEENLAHYKSFLLRNNSLSSNKSGSSLSENNANKDQSKQVELNHYVNVESNSSHLVSSSNPDYVNLPRVSTTTILSNNFMDSNQYNNHIYQNSQTLFNNNNYTMFANVTTTTTMTTNSTMNVSPKRPPKTWFETDLDLHAAQQNANKLINSNYKPIIKPSNNLVLNNNNNNNNLVNDTSDHRTSTTIYHPIHLITNEDNNTDNNNQKQHSVPSGKSYKINFQNHSPLINRSSTVSPTPSQMSGTSSSSSLLHYYNNSGSTLYSNLPTTTTIGSNNLATSTGSLSTNNVTGNAQMTRLQALSPICTVAFVPSLDHDTTTTTTIPIASCKGNIVEVDVVTVGHFQPGYEETKPFTIDDCYKYSQRYRQAKKNQNTNSNNNRNDNKDKDKMNSNEHLSNRIATLTINSGSSNPLTKNTGHQNDNRNTTTTSKNDDNNNNVASMVYS